MLLGLLWWLWALGLPWWLRALGLQALGLLALRCNSGPGTERTMLGKLCQWVPNIYMDCRSQ